MRVEQFVLLEARVVAEPQARTQLRQILRLWGGAGEVSGVRKWVGKRACGSESENERESRK